VLLARREEDISVKIWEALSSGQEMVRNVGRRMEMEGTRCVSRGRMPIKRCKTSVS